MEFYLHETMHILYTLALAGGQDIGALVILPEFQLKMNFPKCSLSHIIWLTHLP